MANFTSCFAFEWTVNAIVLDRTVVVVVANVAWSFDIVRMDNIRNFGLEVIAIMAHVVILHD
eukprot:scaffold209000_cov21-Prasinocladus_malaysianus.AAC.2